MKKPVIVGSGISANSLVAAAIDVVTIGSLEKQVHEEQAYNSLIDLPKNVSMFADADSDTAFSTKVSKRVKRNKKTSKISKRSRQVNRRK